MYQTTPIELYVCYQTTSCAYDYKLFKPVRKSLLIWDDEIINNDMQTQEYFEHGMVRQKAKATMMRCMDPTTSHYSNI